MAKTFLFVILAAVLFVCVTAHRHGSGSGNGQGRPHYQAFMDRYQRDCADDQQRLCPDLDAPQDPRQIAAIFESECFKSNSASMSNPCQQMITDWRNWVSNHHRPKPQQPEETEQPGQVGGDDKPATAGDDDDDDDDNDKEEQNNMESGAQGTPFYEACHDDRVSICPDLPDNVSPHDFFTAKCFVRARLTQDCEKYLEKWIAFRGARMAAFGILISSTVCTIGGLLACLTLLCCIGCCVRRRRLALIRRRACAKKAAIKPKIVEEPAATPLTVQSVEDPTTIAMEPIVGDMENGFPMQTFPAGAAFAPYSYPGAQQYWQPVYFASSQYMPVPTSEPTQQQ